MGTPAWPGIRWNAWNLLFHAVGTFRWPDVYHGVPASPSCVRNICVRDFAALFVHICKPTTLPKPWMPLPRVPLSVCSYIRSSHSDLCPSPLVHAALRVSAYLCGCVSLFRFFIHEVCVRLSHLPPLPHSHRGSPPYFGSASMHPVPHTAARCKVDMPFETPRVQVEQMNSIQEALVARGLPGGPLVRCSCRSYVAFVSCLV